ncbi:aldolase/citrate lyase family protein [Thomasclavelia spiroformis]|uniref:aldolase/citrate lyase family protein n=1 Tax=Thomasclavelia spiroformis TaxID=29348 RepID=UPI000B395D77|nr:aldolase/citrate lyase family protein [Thomasclavelia spiroformis]OUO70295.1 aldolase [Thomasclavelia spiroformis]
MSLTLMYITNNPVTAEIAQAAGVDRIWVDMEYIGKEERQAGMDTVKSHHTIEDIKKLRPILTKSELMVRVNPIHDATENYDNSEKEIEDTIAAGADVIMLPFFKTAQEVKRFIDDVKGRAKVQLLLETAEAVDNLDEILEIPGIDEIHIGLNDLHLEYKKTFMFELLCDGTVETICNKIKNKGIKYGFGGFARVGYGILPAECIITEHYRLKSTAAILSRGFCNANLVNDPSEIRNIFVEGVKNIRLKEQEVSKYNQDEYLENLNVIKERVEEIVKAKKEESK